MPDGEASLVICFVFFESPDALPVHKGEVDLGKI